MEIKPYLSFLIFYLKPQKLVTENIGRRTTTKKTKFKKNTWLSFAMKLTGSDKGIGGHNYAAFYSTLFTNRRRANIGRVFELGIGTNNIKIPSNMGVHGKPGASLRAWRWYFPKAEIFGADIDKKIIFNEPRIRTYYCDQLSFTSIKNMWNKNPELNEKFDLIIEDGLHEFRANKIFFENSINKIKSGGTYVIEDVNVNMLPNWKKIILAKYIKKYPHFNFSIIRIPHPLNQPDNNLIVARSNLYKV